MIRILMGGSPCTSWSIARVNGRETLPEGHGWELFRNFLIAKERYRPDYFLYENNKSAAPAIKNQISRELGVPLQYINSALVSAQNRERFYAHNIANVPMPEDRGIVLRDVLERGIVDREKSYCLTTNVGNSRDYIKKRQTQVVSEEVRGAALRTREVDGRKYKRVEVRHDRKSNAITTVNSDSMVCETLVLGDSIPLNTTKQGKAKCIMAHSCKEGFRDLLGNNYSRRTCVATPIRIGSVGSNSQGHRVYSCDGKSVALTANGGGVGAKTGLYAVPLPEGLEGLVCDKGKVHRVCNGLVEHGGNMYPIALEDGYYLIRKLTVLECKRLQTVREDYIMPCSATQNYKMLGNGWTVEVVAHIISHIPSISSQPVEVLSMYDGMACARLALERVNANVVRYYATEIDKYCIQTSIANFPDIIHLGDAFGVREDGFIGAF